MEELSITFNGVELLQIPVWNKPSYMQHNAYGRLRYIPILEPVDFVSPKEINETNKKFVRNMKVEEIVDDFFKKFPEETGKLNNFYEIEYLGYKYKYHPSHKTHYGNIDKHYIIMPVLVRYYIDYYLKKNPEDKQFLPRGYNEGLSRLDFADGTVQLELSNIDENTSKATGKELHDKLQSVNSNAQHRDSDSIAANIMGDGKAGGKK